MGRPVLSEGKVSDVVLVVAVAVSVPLVATVTPEPVTEVSAPLVFGVPVADPVGVTATIPASPLIPEPTADSTVPSTARESPSPIVAAVAATTELIEVASVTPSPVGVVTALSVVAATVIDEWAVCGVVVACWLPEVVVLAIPTPPVVTSPAGVIPPTAPVSVTPTPGWGVEDAPTRTPATVTVVVAEAICSAAVAVVIPPGLNASVAGSTV